MTTPDKPAPALKPSMKATVGTFSVAALLLLLAQFISPSEGGRRLDVYLDSAGIPTVCTGIIGPEVTKRWKAGQGAANATIQPPLTREEKAATVAAIAHFTDAECDKLEATYLTRMHHDLERCLGKERVDDLSLGEFLAYGDGAYNFGTGAMCNSPMAKLAAQGKRREACEAIANYRVHTGTSGNRKPRGKGTWEPPRALANGQVKPGRWLQDCRDPANKCSGLPKRRARQRDMCLAGLPEAA
jgi:GH24 family phage-related lysozyme (muramidase)